MSPTFSNEHLIVSHVGFQWFVTAAVGGASAWWLLVDSTRLGRALKGDRTRGAVKDQIFGSVIGLLIGAIGLIGAYLGHP